MMKSFVFGVITGATAAWVLKDSIATRVDARTRMLRARAAHRLHAAADAIETGMAGASRADAPRQITRAS